MNSKKWKRMIPLAIRNLYRRIEFDYNYKLINRRTVSKIMIIGCGRSGTTYTSKLFNSLGYKVGHERLERNGISSWLLVSNQQKVFIGPSFEELKSLNLPVVHQVRHPLKAISSFQATGHQSWQFLAYEIPINYEEDSKVLKGMKYWYYWNLMAEEKSSFTYQVENLDDVFPELLKAGQFTAVVDKRNEVAKTTNTRSHIGLSWRDLRREDPVLTDKIIVLAKKYGYQDNLKD